MLEAVVDARLAILIDINLGVHHQGIGRSAALLFAKEGAKVVVSEYVHPSLPCLEIYSCYVCRSLDAAKAQAVVDEIKQAGGDAIAVSGGVGADDFPQKVIEATIKYVRVKVVQ